MTISDLIKSGGPVELELLTELPDSVDPMTWLRVPWSTSLVLVVTPKILLASDGLVATYQAVVTARLDEPCFVRAFGLRFETLGFLVGSVLDYLVVDGQVFTFTASICLYPWVS